MLNEIKKITNEECEGILLSNIIYTGFVLDEIQEVLKPEHFSNYFYNRIFAACQKYSKLEMNIDPLILVNHFSNEEHAEKYKSVIIDLTTSNASLGTPLEYANLIIELYKRRELYKRCHIFSRQLLDLTNLGDLKLLTEANHKENDLILKDEQKNEIVSISDLMESKITEIRKSLADPEENSSLVTDLKEFDAMLGTLNPTDLMIVAGRPSMGKTALVTSIATNIAIKKRNKLSQKGTVLFFSLEMSSQQILARVIASMSNISNMELKNNDLSAGQLNELNNVMETLSDIPFYVEDSAMQTIDSIAKRARRAKESFDIDLIVIDYLQLIKGSTKNIENRVLEISEISRSLKQLAKELNVPVIALSQLSRAVETRECKRPLLSDLRESGSIEQDADQVVFIFREEYYLSRAEPPKTDLKRYGEWYEKMVQARGIAELIIAKNRHGKNGIARVHFDENKTLFS